MLEYLPNETQRQVIKNKLYLENLGRVHVSQRNRLFKIIMKTGKLPRITHTGYILYRIK